jgi:hypothetical protein
MKKLKTYCFIFIQFFCAVIFANAGDTFFSASIVHDINVIFSQPAFWDSLTSYKAINDINPQAPALFLKGNVIIDGVPLNLVGVRLKGNSSYAHPGQKKPLKISFDEFVSGQEYDGLKSFHLNNSSFDPTMIREKMFLDILNKHQLAAPRCAFARLSYNGNYVGLYKVIETVDKTFLRDRFNDNDGNLFKGDPITPLKWEGTSQSAYYDNFELKTNEILNDWSDLVQLINVINNSGSSFKTLIEQNFDVHTYLKIWAANNLFVNFDTYFINPHNFYLYNDSAANKFRWISWDIGLAFGVYPSFWNRSPAETDILYLPGNPNDLPLSKNLYEVEEYKNEYLAYVCEFMYDDFVPAKLYKIIDSLAIVTRPHIYAEPDSNQMYNESQFEGNLNFSSTQLFFGSQVPGIKTFIAERWSKVAQQLCEYNWSCILGGYYEVTDENYSILFPNPATDKLNVSFSFPEYNAAFEYKIVDMAGNVLLHENKSLVRGTTTQIINIANLAAGVYALYINAGCRDVRNKFVVIK